MTDINHRNYSNYGRSSMNYMYITIHYLLYTITFTFPHSLLSCWLFFIISIVCSHRSRRRIGRRQMTNFREMWCSTVFHHLAQNRLWRSHFTRKWTPLFLMLRRKSLGYVMGQLMMHKRVMKVLRRETIVCVGRLKLMMSMCLWALNRRVQV